MDLVSAVNEIKRAAVALEDSAEHVAEPALRHDPLLAGCCGLLAALLASCIIALFARLLRPRRKRQLSVTPAAEVLAFEADVEPLTAPPEPSVVAATPLKNDVTPPILEREAPSAFSAIESLIEAGETLLAAGDLAAVESCMTAALGQMQNVRGAEALRALVYQLRGDGRLARGQGGMALLDFRASVILRRNLAEAKPEDGRARLDLTASLIRVADALSACGDFAGASASYDEALMLRRQEAEAAADSAEAARLLTVCLHKVGDLAAAHGDLDGAMACFDEALHFARRAVELDPEDRFTRRGLSVALDRLGGVRRALGDGLGARAALNKALSLLRTLSQEAPEDLQAQLDHGVALAKTAQIAESLGDAPEALTRFSRAHLIFEGLIGLAPDWAEPRRLKGLTAADAVRIDRRFDMAQQTA